MFVPASTRRRRRPVFVVSFLLLVVLRLTAAPAALQAQDLTIGLMPAVDSIPLLIAEDQGYFEEAGVSVELRMFRNQLYRESALQTNEIDGSISDLINAVYNWQAESGIRVASITDGHFALVTSPGSGIRTVRDWNRAGEVQVGLLENSIIYYVAERMLEEIEGDADAISIVRTLQVPVRLEMVASNQIQAGLLPEPVADLAEQRGAHTLVDSSVLDQTPGVLLFTARALEEKREEIRALYRAYNRAVEAINADPDSFRPAIVRLGEFPPPVEDRMFIPRYQPARPPTPAELADVTGWMLEKGLAGEEPAYREVVAPDVVP